MCSHYEAPSATRLAEGFGLDPLEPFQTDLWPGYSGPFVRASEPEDSEYTLEALTGVFGLLPAWVKDTKLARHTYNARTETVSEKPSFRSAWAKAQHCIIPATAIYEPDWRSGKCVPTRIERVDGGLMGIAGLWEQWIGPAGEVIHSYTMLTINAADHALMANFHKPQDEKRMVVVLPNGLHRDWLQAPVDRSMEFMKQYPAHRLKASAGPE